MSYHRSRRFQHQWVPPAFRSALAAALLACPPLAVEAQGTAFTYQGRLNVSGSPANGAYDFSLALYDAATSGTQAGSTQTSLGVGVSNGLFTVTTDFGAQFNGTPYWLQIQVRPSGTSTFTTLSTRQPLTPTPYAVTAENFNGPIAPSQLSGPLPAADLPANVLTNGAASAAFGNVTVDGGLTLAAPGNIGFTGPGFLGGTLNTTLLLDDAAVNGFFAGLFAGNTALSGDDNAGFGDFVLFATTTGAFNTGVGFEALANDNVGGGNTALGCVALEANTNGYNNVAVGYEALQINQNGYDNVGIGCASFQNLTDGAQNTAVGTYAFQNLTTGSGNTVLGYSAGKNLTTGNNNIDIGNAGQGGDDGIIRIGSSQTQAYIAGQVALGGAAPQQTLSLDGGLNLDESGGNSGAINTGNANGYGLTFGSASGEGIASQRQATGGNQYGLDFYTDFTKRLSISQSGQVSVTGDFLVVNGGTPVYCYLGDDGYGNDVQIGSQKSGVTALSCYNTADNAYMHVFCGAITIEGGSDVAEPFNLSAGGREVPAGAVLVIDEANPGRLKVSDTPYDPHVAGVVSGANGIHPGIQMQQQGLLEGGKNVALTGRVYVQADASNGPIKPGDLLTTSRLPGYAMKVTDHARAAGAILGKAMTGLREGQGMVLILVTLQ